MVDDGKKKLFGKRNSVELTTFLNLIWWGRGCGELVDGGRGGDAEENLQILKDITLLSFRIRWIDTRENFVAQASGSNFF